ncbi:TPA: hypothetical protein GRI77_19755 [Vibrio parahaemolyticus]|uniref:hypothetical protein n=1 Tax=Vibrio parahaemolyticus TaxID=670 RepID=UPI0007A0AC35|nr:hypothetical protein [Vibrio parahaemolyticus]EGQ9353238.1 hypothetical protein [Vibrio parahaemolyticus]EGQ9515706.1 hypothetical protein [Vibrio parahaemolyticus]EIM7931145.1 hypothetical protein [Vibrio parahaemolyticus]EJQ8019138.1 hypothetical protein [Vibrio parahaemolyticus]EJU8977733.1 hypothetical protein [Vibrio parahaemolyticus]
MTEQLNEVEENKEVESKDKDQQLKDLLQENEDALKAQRERDEKIAKLKLSMKEEALDEFEETYRTLDITPQDLAKRFGFKIAEEKEEVESENKKKGGRKPAEHPMFEFIGEGGIHYRRGSPSPTTFFKEPWKSLLFDGDINDHCPLYYADIPEEEIKVSGKYKEAVKTIKVTRKYFTQAMINEGKELPTNKVEINRGDDKKVIKNIDAFRASVRSMMESAK